MVNNHCLIIYLGIEINLIQNLVIVLATSIFYTHYSVSKDEDIIDKNVMQFLQMTTLILTFNNNFVMSRVSNSLKRCIMQQYIPV